jgi:hypothetical protein
MKYPGAHACFGECQLVNTYRTAGIVIRTTNVREADSFLTILTAELGRVSALARSARSSKKRFMGGFDLFDCGVFVLGAPKTASGPYIVEELGRREMWNGLREDLQKFTLASYCLEISLHFAQEGDPEGAALFLPLFRSLRSINSAEDAERSRLFAIYYNAVLLQLSGFNVIDDAPRLAENPELQQWLCEMLATDQAILPFNRSLLKDGFRFLGFYTQEIIGHEIRSLNVAMLQT